MSDRPARRSFIWVKPTTEGGFPIGFPPPGPPQDTEWCAWMGGEPVECLECPPNTIAGGFMYGKGFLIHGGSIGSVFGAPARAVRMSPTEIIVLYETSVKMLQKVGYVAALEDDLVENPYTLIGSPLELDGSAGGNIRQDCVMAKIAEDRLIIVRHTGVVRDSLTWAESPVPSVVELYDTNNMALLHSEALPAGHLYGGGEAAIQMRDGLVAVGSMFRDYVIDQFDNTGGPNTPARYLFIRLSQNGMSFDVTEFDVPRAASGYLGEQKNDRFAVNDHQGATFPVRLADDRLVITAFWVDGTDGRSETPTGFWGQELVALAVDEVDDDLVITTIDHHIVDEVALQAIAECDEWDRCWYQQLYDIKSVRQLEGPCTRLALSYNHYHHGGPRQHFIDFINDEFMDAGFIIDNEFYLGFKGDSLAVQGIGQPGLEMMPLSYPHCDQHAWFRAMGGPSVVDPNSPWERGIYAFLTHYAKAEGEEEEDAFTVLGHIPPSSNPEPSKGPAGEPEWGFQHLIPVDESGFGHILLYEPNRIALRTIRVDL